MTVLWQCDFFRPHQVAFRIKAKFRAGPGKSGSNLPLLLLPSGAGAGHGGGGRGVEPGAGLEHSRESDEVGGEVGEGESEEPLKDDGYPEDRKN